MSTYLEGALHYAFLFDTKDKFDRWSVAVTLEGDQVRNAKNLGLKVKQDADKFNGLPYVQLKSNYQPKLFGADGGQYEGPTSLANGSLGVVKLTQRPYNNKFGTGVTTFIAAVKITKPIPYMSSNSDSFGQDSSAPEVELLDDVPF
jgi:hypothetical protein